MLALSWKVDECEPLLLGFYAVFTVIYAATEVGFLWGAPWVTSGHHHAS